MKSFLVFLFVVTAAAAGSHDALMEKCLAESGATEEEVGAFDEAIAKNKTPFEISHPVACFQACILTATGLMSADGTLTASTRAGFYQKHLQGCFNSITETDRCDRAAGVRKCYIKVYSD